jgi:uncharacterized protein (DUF983 family)
MGFRHSCSFCGRSRLGRTSVMLVPNCEHCGCALDAVPVTDEPGPLRASTSLPPVATFVLIRLAVVLAVLALYAGARLGFAVGGAPGAITGIGLTGFLLLPCVPKRA